MSRSATGLATVAVVVVVLTALTTVAETQRQVRVTPCKIAGKGELKMLTATPCTGDPCQIKKGSVTRFDFAFVPEQDSATLTIDAHVNIMGFHVRVPGIDPNLCQNTISCPIRKGELITGSFNMTVPRVPIRKTIVEVKIMGDHGLSACFTHAIHLK